MEPNRICAAQLAHGAAGRVIELQHSGTLRRRLLDLGLIPGASICRRYTAPAGTPIAFEISGAVVALRKKDAEKVYVQEVQQAWTP